MVIKSEQKNISKSILFYGLLIILVAVGCIRIVNASGNFWQTWDEPIHIAAGMEWLEKHQYTYEPLHPPLARVMCALGLYMDGVRGVKGLHASDFEDPDILPWMDGNSCCMTGEPMKIT